MTMRRSSVFRLAVAFCTSTAVLLSGILSGTAPAAAGCDSPSVLMLLPDSADNPFWGPYADFAVAVAKDLGVRLTIDHAATNDRFDYVDRLETLLAGPEKPDYVAAFPYFGAMPRLMQEATEAGLSVVTLNSDIGHGDRNEVGYPRERHKNWILQSMANDESAGFLLAKAIAGAARERAALTQSDTVALSAIGGNQLAASSLYRRDGLQRFIGEADGTVSINQFVFTDWSYDRGKAVAAGLARRYPVTHGVWAANLPLGLGAVDAWLAASPAGPQPVFGAVSGPFDDRALAAIDDGRFSAVVGGHFLEGGIVLVLLLDHFNGMDFVDEIGTALRIPFETIDKQNITRIRRILGEREWKGLDFKHLTKCYATGLTYYDFDLESVLQR